MIVNGHMQGMVSRCSGELVKVACDPMTGTIKAGKLLHIHMQNLARCLPLIAALGGRAWARWPPRRGVFRSVPELNTAIKEYIAT